MKIPCKDCITLAICRHKPIGPMLRCELITDYHAYHLKDMGSGSLKYLSEVRKHRLILQRVVRPTKWNLDADGFFEEGSKLSYLTAVKEGGRI